MIIDESGVPFDLLVAGIVLVALAFLLLIFAWRLPPPNSELVTLFPMATVSI
jgi:hypothetical protein